MSKSVRTFVSVFVVAALVLTTIGVSYSYFTDNLSGGDGNINIIKSTNGRMEVAFAGENIIDFSNSNGGSDAVYEKTFSIKGTNNNSNNLTYKLNLVVDENKYNNSEVSFSLVGYNPVSNGLIIPNIDLKPINNGANKVDLGSGYFNNANEVVHTYTIKFYLSKNNNNGSFRAHIEAIEG